MSTPSTYVQARGWLRDNLFSSPANALTTIALLALTAWLASKFVNWAILNALFGKATVAACNALAGQGACWSVVADKWRQMLFGIYPQVEQWRPMLAVLLFCAILVLSALRWFWRAS